MFPDSQHVTAPSLDTATDREISDYAREHECVIVSKDSEFRQLAFLHGPPPKIDDAVLLVPPGLPS